MKVDELLRTMGEQLAGTAGVRSVYGDPVTAGERTVIPVAEVRYGFGAGGGTRKDESDSSGGGGGGVRACPAGALEISPEGTRFIPFEDKRRLVAALAAGFVLGALVAALARPKRIEIVKKPA